jgi:hypothetical protein
MLGYQDAGLTKLPVYSESDLIIPALEIIADQPDGIGTNDLIPLLRRQLKPSGDDLILLANRTDDRFSQKVRNLKSHDTLERRGLARFDDGKYYATDVGRNLVSEGVEISNSLREQGFDAEQRSEALDRNYVGIVIEEGERIYANRSVSKRSQILKRAALKKFANRDGSIECRGCGFRAEAAYGPTLSGMIDIHHTRPIFLNAGRPRQESLAEALNHAVPLCPNCIALFTAIPPGACPSTSYRTL